MKVRYAGYDVAGQPVADAVEARTVAEAAEIVRRQGIFVTEIAEAGAGGRAGAERGTAPGAGARRGRRVGPGTRLRHVAMFTRQLHVLLSTGTPLVQSLSALERQATEPRWRHVVEHVRSAVEEGSSLSNAMAEHPQYFDAICRSLVAAGESAGNLPVMLERLAVLTRKQLHVRRSIIGATIYPCLLVIVAAGVLITLLTFVLPRFQELFKSLDTPLPPTTQLLMTLSQLLRSYWWAAVLIGGAGGTGLWWWLKTAAGRLAVDTIALRLPQFGAIVKSFATARITRLLGILLQGRVPLVDALHLTHGACGNHHYARLIEAAAEAVTRGEALGSALADPRLIAPSVQEAVISGERSGQLGPLLGTLADFMDETNEVTVRALTTLLEPLILIVLGVLVGIVAVSMFMPLFDLTAATRGGG